VVGWFLLCHPGISLADPDIDDDVELDSADRLDAYADASSNSIKATNPNCRSFRCC